MTDEAGQPRITVRFAAVGSAVMAVDIGPEVTIAQLQLAAVELTELAREARAGERTRQAQQRLETLAVAQRLQAGRRQ